jgi:hypothetical protein
MSHPESTTRDVLAFLLLFYMAPNSRVSEATQTWVCISPIKEG